MSPSLNKISCPFTMQFPVSPETQGDSHLFVVLSERKISFLLVSVDYERMDVETEGISIPIPPEFSVEDDFEVFIAKSLCEWAKDVGWCLVKCQDDVCMLSLCDEDCVGGATLIVDPMYSSLIERSVVLGAEPIVRDDQWYVDASAQFFQTLDASSLVHVILNWDSVRVLYLSKDGGLRTGKINGGDDTRGAGISAREMSLEGEYLGKLVEQSIPSLLSVSIRTDNLLDMLGNVTRRRISASGSSELHDVLRAYATAALFGMKERGLRSFGMNDPDDILLVSGDIPGVLPLSHTMLAVIDGLQLRGKYQIIVDQDGRTIPGGTSLIHKQFAFPLRGMFPRRFLYISTEKGGSGRVGSTAFRGKIHDIADEGEDVDERFIVGQTGQMYNFPLGGVGQLMLEPAKSVFFPNLAKVKHGGKMYLAAEYGRDISSAVIDCRKIPVVYGPDAQGNHGKVDGWLGGLPNV